MAVKPIIIIPDPILETPAEKVDNIDDNIKQLIKDLLDTVLAARNPEGAGLAAPQIGVSKRICVVRRFHPHPTSDTRFITKEYVLINPKIISESKEKNTRYEACLSIPEVYGPVERARKIKIKALDENGQPVRLSASGFFARVIQHEIDHLDGILFTSKLSGDPITENEFDQLIEEDEDL